MLKTRGIRLSCAHQLCLNRRPPLALLAHVACFWTPLCIPVTSLDMVVACTDGRAHVVVSSVTGAYGHVFGRGCCVHGQPNAPSHSSGARDRVGKWTVDWMAPGWPPLAPLAHTAASEDGTACTRQPRPKAWLSHERCLIFGRIRPRSDVVVARRAGPLASLAVSSTPFCVQSLTSTYHLDTLPTLLDGRPDGRLSLSLLWCTPRSMYTTRFILLTLSLGGQD